MSVSPSLPRFPEFTPIRLSHRSAIAQFTKKFPTFADYTFVSLYSWNVRGVVALSSLYGNLVVRFSDDTTDETFLSFIGTHELEKTIDALMDYAQTHTYNPNLCLIPQPIIKAMPRALRAKYIILEDRNNHDYVLSVSNLSQFASSKFKQRKANYNKFVNAYGDRVTCGIVDLTSPSAAKQVKKLLSSWRKARQKSERATRNEFVAINRCLKHSQRLEVQAFGTYLDGKLVALNVFEILDDMAIGHFIKANTTYRGISEHLVHMFAKYLQSKKVAHINIQQDLGIEGLRAYKLSYRPVYFFKKYTISKAL